LVLEFWHDFTSSSWCILKDFQWKRRNTSRHHTWIYSSKNRAWDHVLARHGIMLDCHSNHGRLLSMWISRSRKKMAILDAEEFAIFRNCRRANYSCSHNTWVNRHNERIWFSDILEEFSELLGYLLDHDTFRIFLSNNTQITFQNNKR